MTLAIPGELELTHLITSLAGSRIRLSLMSVASLSVPRLVLKAAAATAAAPLDAVGVLADGSIGILSLRADGADSGTEVEDRLCSRLRNALATARNRGTISLQWFWFRSIHRWASELSSSRDLVDSLFDTAARPISLSELSGIIPGYMHPAQPANNVLRRNGPPGAQSFR